MADGGPPALVTGASGFIGRHLVSTLLRQNRRVLALCRRPGSLFELSDPRIRIICADLEDKGSYLPHLTRDLTVFHLAAIRNRPGSTPDEFRRVNEIASLQLALACAQAGVKKFIYVSSAVVFGPSQGRAVSEANGVKDPGIENCYIQTRVRAQQAMNKLVEGGLPLVTLCPTIVFGPDHPTNPNRITSQIRRLLRTRIEVTLGDGNQSRNLVFVEDVIRGILQAEKSESARGEFILGGEDITHRAFNEMVFSLAGRKRWARISIPAGIARKSSRFLDWMLRYDRGAGYESAVDMLLNEWQYTFQKAREILGYNPLPLHIAILETIRFIEGEV